MESRVQRLARRKRDAQSRRRFRVLVLALSLATTIGVGALGASAAIDDGPGRGNPAVNPTGHCPPGQNQDTSVGGLKKCGE